MLLVIPQLLRAEFPVEVEIVVPPKLSETEEDN
jgi:hypothetical protein